MYCSQFATNQFLKMTTISPGWDGGGGVSWSSLSRLRGRDPVSSGFPSPPFINHFVSLNFFSPVIWLYCCSGSLRNALLLDITKSWIWYRCDHHNPPIILIIISVFFFNIPNIYVGDDYMIYVSSFPISPTNGSPGPVRCLIREILVGSLIKPGLGTFTLDLSGHKSWDRRKIWCGLILIRRQPCWSGLCQPDLGLALLRLSDQDWGQKMHKSVDDNVTFNRCLRYLYQCWDTQRAWESWKPAEILSPKKSRGWGGVHHIDDYWGGLGIGDYWCGCILMFDCGLHHMRIKAGLWLYWWESWFAAEC